MNGYTGTPRAAHPAARRDGRGPRPSEVHGQDEVAGEGADQLRRPLPRSSCGSARRPRGPAPARDGTRCGSGPPPPRDRARYGCASRSWGSACGGSIRRRGCAPSPPDRGTRRRSGCRRKGPPSGARPRLRGAPGRCRPPARRRGPARSTAAASTVPGPRLGTNTMTSRAVPSGNTKRSHLGVPSRIARLPPSSSHDRLSLSIGAHTAVYDSWCRLGRQRAVGRGGRDGPRLDSPARGGTYWSARRRARHP